MLPAIALFWGEGDRIIPIQQGEELAAMLENCSLRRFPRAGQFLHWEQPHGLASALPEYLAAPNVASAKLGPDPGKFPYRQIPVRTVRPRA